MSFNKNGISILLSEDKMIPQYVNQEEMKMIRVSIIFLIH